MSKPKTELKLSALKGSPLKRLSGALHSCRDSFRSGAILSVSRRALWTPRGSETQQEVIHSGPGYMTRGQWSTRNDTERPVTDTPVSSPPPSRRPTPVAAKPKPTPTVNIPEAGIPEEEEQSEEEEVVKEEVVELTALERAKLKVSEQRAIQRQ